MKAIEKCLDGIRNNPASASFSDALRVAEHYFGKPRISGSHHIFKMPWRGNPRINLQEDKSGGAKTYQVRQLLAAIDLLTTSQGRKRE
jgi:hypothetical protein